MLNGTAASQGSGQVAPRFRAARLIVPVNAVVGVIVWLAVNVDIAAVGAFVELDRRSSNLLPAAALFWLLT